MTVQKGESFEKRIEFKALDDERRVAFGGVMVPDKVDLQGDWLTPDLIQSFSDEFMARLPDGEAVPGVMHAVFPEQHVSLAENTILDETRDVNGKEFPAGSWLQGWKFEDDELWALVKDGVLSGYSIGASDVTWSEPTEQSALPDNVTVADAYPEDEPVWQILDGTVNEVSSVDIPAVPDAVMVAVKSGEKSVLDHVNGKNEFVGVMQDRGASEDEAERLWHYLQRAVDEADGKAASDSFFKRLGRGAWEAIAGSGEKSTEPATETTAKQGRTLSGATRRRLMAAHDSIEDALAADVEFERNRFTDNEDFAFDVADYGKHASTDEHAPGGETPGTDSKQMGDNPTDDAPEWAKPLIETTEKNSDAIEALSEKVEGEEEKDAWDDAPEWAKDLREEQKGIDERVESLAEASGKSQQLSGGNGGDETNGKTKADFLGIPGGDA